MANVIANYTFNKDKSMVIFDNKYHIVARHLLKIRDIPKGIQVYDNDNFVGNYGRLYFKNNRLQVFQEGNEVAYCKVNDDFFTEVANQLPEIKEWTF